jgi:hypothetical protein
LSRKKLNRKKLNNYTFRPKLPQGVAKNYSAF